VPKLFEYNTFKDKNIRYLATSKETKFTKQLLKKHNIPDLSIDEIVDVLHESMKKAGQGQKPAILVCHSMSDLVAKKLVLKMNQDVILI
jgi:hypothetical protein